MQAGSLDWRERCRIACLLRRLAGGRTGEPANSATAGAPGLPLGGSGSTGPPGDAFGGGIYDGGGSSQTVTLASVTLASNAASDGGNLWARATGLAVGDAIISSG